MYVKLRVKHEDGTKLLDGEVVAPVNFLAIPVFTDRGQAYKAKCCHRPLATTHIKPTYKPY